MDINKDFEAWWDKNEKQFIADSCHMSEFHMAGVVWEAAVQSRWQPIETAPNDGKQFICWNGNEMAILNQPPGCAIGRWHKTSGKWNGGFVSFDKPTHWMPIPEAPNAEIRG